MKVSAPELSLVWSDSCAGKHVLPHGTRLCEQDWIALADNTLHQNSSIDTYRALMCADYMVQNPLVGFAGIWINGDHLAAGIALEYGNA